MRVCSGDYLLTGFRANTLEYQGTFTDDVAVENFEVLRLRDRIVSGEYIIVSKSRISLQNL
ncbi:hypothetical protein Avbf_10701 [Armadillidium vulgare]|nr:hypothetical protein Avbf_10701 [Armadillidium vulgare]